MSHPKHNHKHYHLKENVWCKCIPIQHIESIEICINVGLLLLMAASLMIETRRWVGGGAPAWLAPPSSSSPHVLLAERRVNNSVAPGE